MRRSSTSPAAVLIIAAMMLLRSAAACAQPAVLYVDDSASAGGDGSQGQPFQTIQQAIAQLPADGGTIFINPGTYFGPILVDRDDVVLCGLAEPVYDDDGYLAGFTSDDPDDDAVVITIDRPLQEGDPVPGDPVDLVALAGSNNQVRNVVIDSGNVPWPSSSAAFSAEALDDDFYENIVFSHIIVRGVTDLAGYCAKSDTRFEYITSLEPGFTGIWAMANGNVEVRNVHISRKAANVIFAALDEKPSAENGPSTLTALLKDSKLTNANGFVGFFTDATGLLVLGRKNQVNPDESSTIVLEATGNLFQNNGTAVMVRAVFGPNGFSEKPTQIGLDFHDNAYVNNYRRNVDVDYQAPPWSGNYFAASTSIVVDDADGVFPNPADVELGPADNENSYDLNP